MTDNPTLPEDQDPSAVRDARHRRNLRVLTGFFAVALIMVGFAYAAVPLYSVFCRVTGYGGTTQSATALPDKVLDRYITVEFDSNVSTDLPWQFRPLQHSVKVQVGEPTLVFFEAHNSSNKAFVGQAAFNVSPQKAGLYFTKVQCFCFSEQFVGAGETVQMPVSFFIDPSIADDSYMDDVTTMTLSYTFYNVEDPSREMRERLNASARQGSSDPAAPKG